MLNSIKDIKNRPATSITEPVTLAEVKEWLIIDHTDDDTLLTRLISRARAAIENKTKISLVERTIVLTVDLHSEIKLPHGPVRAISEVIFRQGTNSDGTPDNETLTIEDYTTDGADFIRLKSAKCGRHKITYTAGYGVDTGLDPDFNCPVPDDLKTAILMEIAYRYEHRGDETKAVSSAGNETVQKISGLSADTMQYIKPYIDYSWV